MKIKEELPPKVKDLVGNTLLGQDPRIAKLQRKKPEPDTEWERDLATDLDSWTDSSTDYLAKKFLKNKGVFDKLASEYPTIMQAPQGKQAYRGTHIKLKSIVNAIETKPFKVVKIKDGYYIRFTKFPYSPKRPAQSWTVDPKIATNFGSADGWFNNVAQVLYSTKVDDSFVFNPKLLAIVFGSNENEVVRVNRKGEFDALISANFLAKRLLLHRLKGLRAYFEKARVIWNTKHAPQMVKKGDDIYSLKDLTIPSWSSLRKVEGYENGLGPVGKYYRKVVGKALRLLAKR